MGKKAEMNKFGLFTVLASGHRSGAFVDQP